MPSNRTFPPIDRRRFVKNSSMALAAVAGTSGLVSRLAWGEPAPAETVEVQTAYGRLRGTRQRDLVTFEGVPYAGSVSERIDSKHRRLLNRGLELATPLLPDLPLSSRPNRPSEKRNRSLPRIAWF